MRFLVGAVLGDYRYERYRRGFGAVKASVEMTSPLRSPQAPAGRRRVVLHVDADAFFCQCERLWDPGKFAGVDALAVFQHSEVIAVDAGAKRLGVKKYMTPEDARRVLQNASANHAVLQHVPTTDDFRVTYTRYLEMSKALHVLLGSPEMNHAVVDAIARSAGGTNGSAEPVGRRIAREKNYTGTAVDEKTVPAIVVEKASIDEAYVQLPKGCQLAEVALPVANAIRGLVEKKLGLTVSVGASWNKSFAKWSSLAAKPDGVLVTVTDDSNGNSGEQRLAGSEGDVVGANGLDGTRVVSPKVLLGLTRVTKIKGCGSKSVAEKFAALGVRVLCDVSGLGDDAFAVANTLRYTVGLPNAIVNRIVQIVFHHADHDPVLNKGHERKSVSVHMSLATTQRRMPRGATHVVPSTGGREGWFDPVRVGETNRVQSAVHAMSVDLAQRVLDEILLNSTVFFGEVAHPEQPGVQEALAGPPVGRYPRVLQVAVTSVGVTSNPARGHGGKRGRDRPNTPLTVSRQTGFPTLGDTVPTAPGKCTRNPTAPGKCTRIAKGLGEAIAAAARSLLATLLSKTNDDALLTKLSLTASDIRCDRRVPTGILRASAIKDLFPPVETMARYIDDAKVVRGTGVRAVLFPNEKETPLAEKETETESWRSRNGSTPIDSVLLFRALGRREIDEGTVHDAKKARVAFLGRHTR